MTNRFNTYKLFCIAVLCVAGFVSCTKERPSSGTSDPVGKEIVFCIGDNKTKSGIPFLADEGRFVCKMYYHSESGTIEESTFNRKDTVLTWFKISGSDGNALFWNSLYTTPSAVDQYGDKKATRFYWKNRHTHCFLAYTDNSKLFTATSADGLEMSTTKEYITRADGRYYFNTCYVMKKKDGTAYSSMAEQPDPMLAFTKQSPEQSTIEANRVNLIFEHQLSQIQVNIKNSDDGSVVLADPESVAKTELLGVSELMYIPHQMRTNGEIYPSFAKEVKLSAYTKEQLKENPYGTSFTMFRAANTTAGYLTTFEAVAAGKLGALRITWYEETEGNIRHKVSYDIPTSEFSDLEPGMRYIYNIELRRSTLVVLRASVIEWANGDTYTGEGFLKK